MPNKPHQNVFPVRTGAALLGLVFLATTGLGQQGVVVQNFRVAPEYHKPPNERQMKSLLEGAKAQQEPGGRGTLVTGARLQTFLENGQREMLVETPQCRYDQDKKSINSAGHIKVQTADGKFSIEGEGFLWRQTNSSLIISNQVRTIVEANLLSAQGALSSTNQPVQKGDIIEITSEEFDYDADSGLGRYQRDVRVTGTNMNFTAGILTFKLPMQERQVHSILAEQNAVLDYETLDHEKIHAFGEKVLYSTDTGVVHVSGNPAWRTAQWEGHGDELTIDRTNRIFRTDGHAYLKMAGQSAGPSGLLSRSQSKDPKSPISTNQFVEISSDSYEVRTNWAVFRKDVEVKEHEGDQLKGTMICALMTVTFAGTNQLQDLVAEQRVVISQEDKQFTAERAVYTGTNGILELTDHPAWRVGEREGKGEVIQVNTLTEEIAVTRDAWMKLPANELGQSGGLRIGTNIVSSGTMTNRSAEVFCDEYRVKEGLASFLGNVRIDHPLIKWMCPKVTVQLPAAGQTGQRIVAEPKVVFDLTSENGQKIHGIGDRAVYTRQVTGGVTNALVELTGNPAKLQTTNGIVVQNKVLLLDIVSSKFIVPPGNYHIQGTNVTVKTNLFQMPKNRFFRTRESVR